MLNPTNNKLKGHKIYLYNGNKLKTFLGKLLIHMISLKIMIKKYKMRNRNRILIIKQPKIKNKKKVLVNNYRLKILMTKILAQIKMFKIINNRKKIINNSNNQKITLQMNQTTENSL